MDEFPALSKSERKKARRRERKSAERAEGQELEALTDQAVEIAMQLAPEVAAAPTRESSERVIDVSVTTVDAIVSAIEEIAQGGETGIGIGVAGLVDPSNGVLVWGPHLSGTHLSIGSRQDSLS